MIGCTVTSLSISGIRLVWIMLRFTMIHDCCAMFVGRVRAADRMSRRLLRVTVMRRPPRFIAVGAMAGERQEHVVEAGPGQADVVDLDLAVAQPARDPDHVCEAVGGRGELARAGVDEHLGAGLGQQRRGPRAGRRRSRR